MHELKTQIEEERVGRLREMISLELVPYAQTKISRTILTLTLHITFHVNLRTYSSSGIGQIPCAYRLNQFLDSDTLRHDAH
jgi:hypothetical protein